MADIELVIKIPEEKYLYAKNLVNDGKENNPVVLAIGNGTPLPKGHGRLIDANEIKRMIEEVNVNSEHSKTFADNIIRFVSTTIEADTESEDKE